MKVTCGHRKRGRMSYPLSRRSTIHELAKTLTTQEISDKMALDASVIRASLRETGLPERKCKWCLGQYPPTNTKQIYCSKKCANSMRSKRRRERRLPQTFEVVAGAWPKPARFSRNETLKTAAMACWPTDILFKAGGVYYKPTDPKEGRQKLVRVTESQAKRIMETS